MNFLIVFGAKYLYILIAIIAFATILLSSKDLRARYIRLTVFAFPISFLVAKLFGYFIIDPRPFVVEHIEPLIHASADNGFPSDHTLLAVTIALVIFTYNKKIGSFLLLFSFLVGVSRVLAHAHHYEDIIGSILISLIAVSVSQILVKRFRFNLPFVE